MPRTVGKSVAHPLGTSVASTVDTPLAPSIGRTQCVGSSVRPPILEAIRGTVGVQCSHSHVPGEEQILQAQAHVVDSVLRQVRLSPSTIECLVTRVFAVRGFECPLL